MAYIPDLTKNVFIDFEAFLKESRRTRYSEMPQYQYVIKSALRALPEIAYKSYYFISHRWDSPTSPDPNRWQHDVLHQFAIELEANDAFPSCFWYDASCLPQGKLTAEENIVFNAGLENMNALSIGCKTIALISGSGEPFDDFYRQLKRGWILCEMILAYRSSMWMWSFHQDDWEIFSAARARTAQSNHIIEDTLKSMPLHDKQLLLDWLHSEGVKCTNSRDLPYLAGRMVEFGYEVNGRGDKLPRIPEGVIYHLSDEEIGKYSIDYNGRSPYFPGCTVKHTPGINGGYDVIVQRDAEL